MEHSVDLSAKTFVQAISTLSKSDDDEESGAEVSEGEEIEREAAANSIGKALLLVKQVCLSWLLGIFKVLTKL